MMKSIQFIAGDDGNNHLMVIGTTGLGKSSLLLAEALKLDITYDELLKSMVFTDDEAQLQSTLAKELLKLEQKQNNRLQAVRDAYWSATDVDGLEFATIHNALIEFCEVEEPTNAQTKVVFDLLPREIIGSGIQWGFSDTVVRDDIYGFVRENAELIKHSVRSV